MEISLIDVILLPLSYVYVFTVIWLATILKRSGKISGKLARKLVHIGVGTIVILIPIIFSSRIIPTLIGVSFIGITYVTSPVSPFDRLKMTAFKEGHGLGTVFYSISLTCLIFLFFNDGWIVQVGFLPLVYGDAFASIIGERYGNHKWKFSIDKSIEGSSAGFAVTTISLCLVLSLYVLVDKLDASFSTILLLALMTSFIMVIVEVLSPYGTDNLSIPIVCTGLAIYFDKIVFN
jgi:dolichol kinase